MNGHRSILGGLKRAGVVFGVALAVSVVLGLLGALLFGSSVERGVSLALFLSGSLFLLLGVFQGMRGPIAGRAIRAHIDRSDDGGRSDAWQDTMGVSVLFVLIGFVLVLVAVLADPHRGVH